MGPTRLEVVLKSKLDEDVETPLDEVETARLESGEGPELDKLSEDDGA